MIIGKQFTFDSAHYLPEHKGMCKNLHGHTWTLWVELEGPIDPDTGMVADFNQLKSVVHHVIDELDHNLLNKVVSITPTVENLSGWIANELVYYVPEPITKIIITLQEGKGGYAKYELDLRAGQTSS